MSVPALSLILTTAGLERFTKAQVQEDIDLTVATVAVTSATFVVAPTLTAIPGEIKRIATVSGQPVGDNIVHMIVRDESPTTYSVRGFGLFLADGTLFAVYSQAMPICEKSALSTLLFAIDMAFPTAAVSQLVFGDTDFLNPPATTETKGVVEIGTDGEAIAGLDPLRVPSIKGMAAAFSAWLGSILSAYLPLSQKGAPGGVASLAGDGKVPAAQLPDIAASVPPGRRVDTAGLATGGGTLEDDRTITVTAATAEQARAGTATDVVVTPATLAAGAVPVSELGESGRRVHADGYIEMWGVYPGPFTSEQQRTIVFDHPFPTECFGIRGTIRNTSASGYGDTQVQEVSVYPTGATVYVQGDSGMSDAAGGFRWEARGR